MNLATLGIGLAEKSFGLIGMKRVEIVACSGNLLPFERNGEG